MMSVRVPRFEMVRLNVLKWSSLRSSRSNDDRVLHGVVLLQGLDELGDGGTLLADGDVDAVELESLIAALVPPVLVEDGIESDSSLASLTIADDKLTLATANGHHGVDGLKTGLHGLVDRAARENTRSLHLSTTLLGGLDRALAVDGVAEGVNNTAKHGLADWDVDLGYMLDEIWIRPA
jgi:hypothetical protein